MTPFPRIPTLRSRFPLLLSQQLDALTHAAMRWLLRIALFFSFCAAGRAWAEKVGSRSDDGIWVRAETAALPGLGRGRDDYPQRASVYTLNMEALDRVLASAPLEFSHRALSAQPTIAMPIPDGEYVTVSVVESPILSPGLTATHPEVTTFVIQGVMNRTLTGRVAITPLGLSAILFSEAGITIVRPATGSNEVYHIAYRVEDLPETQWQCLTARHGGHPGLPPGYVLPQQVVRSDYGLVITTTGEFTDYWGASTFAEIVSIVSAVNAVFERDTAVHLTLVATAIFPDPLTDPFPDPSDYGAIANLNQAVADDSSGGNYDIGHVLHMPPGTLDCSTPQVTSAGVTINGPNVCVPDFKARATSVANNVACLWFPLVVAHEMGHQLGASHTYNSTSAACCMPMNCQRESTSAYEPGSGSTIMSYAGRCAPENVDGVPDGYFHGRSIEQIMGYVFGSSTCDSAVTTGNNRPTVNAGPDYTTPRDTPFTLTALADDADQDPLTFCWEQFDIGDPSPPPNNANGPVFRSRSATTSPSRTFPPLSNILSGTVDPWDKVPTVDRSLNFRVTVRDARAGAGGVNWDGVTLTVSGAPFYVTLPNTAVLWPAGSSQTVTWQIGGSSPASLVNVLLSVDGGNTYLPPLLANTPNDGTAIVVLPAVESDSCRVMVKPVDNVFFDVSNTNFMIHSNPLTPTNLSAAPGNGSVSIQWQASASGNVDRYIIYRDVVPGATDSVAGVASPETSYVDLSVSNETTYYYRARAVSTSGLLSDYSNEASARPDDDLAGPLFSGYFPTLGTAGTAFKINCDITDPSGVYDDGTGSAGQGVYLLWDNDGELSVDANEALMSLKGGNTYETDNDIPAQSEGTAFVYEVVAYDNDFDNANPLDRTQRRGGLQSIAFGASQNGLLAIEIVPVYPTGFPFKPDERAEFQFYVRDPANGNALIDTDTQSFWRSPPGHFETPIEHLGIGHYHFPPSDLYVLSTAYYTWTFTVEKAGYGLSSAAFSQAVGNVQSYDPVQIQTLTVDPSAFCPGFQNAAIIFSLSKACRGDLSIIRLPDSTVVRSLLRDDTLSAGPDTILWDGRDGGGTYVPVNQAFFVKLDIRATAPWGDLGNFGSELLNPTGMAFRSNGWVYVTDAQFPQRCAVTVYNENRSFLRQVGTCGTGNGQFTGAQDIAFDNSGFYYVLDTVSGGRIQKFNVSNDAFVTSWNYAFDSPGALSRDDGGYLYMSTGPGVRKINPANGSTLLTFPSSRPGDGARPVTGIAVDGRGRIYCALWNFGEIRVYSPSGQYITHFDAEGYDTEDGSLDMRSGRWLYVRAPGGIRVYDSENLADGVIGSYGNFDSGDMGIAVNDIGNVVTTTQAGNFEAWWLRDFSSFAALATVFQSSDYCSTVTGVPPSDQLPEDLVLMNPIPNPTTGITEIRYATPKPGRVRVSLFDVTGREVSKIRDAFVAAGPRTELLDLRGISGAERGSGIYFLRVESQGKALTRKLVLVK